MQKVSRDEFTANYYRTAENPTRKGEEAAWKDSGLAVRRGKGGREDFYDYLRNGNAITSERELKEYIESEHCSFSDNERKPSNYGHWLAIAELVESVRG